MAKATEYILTQTILDAFERQFCGYCPREACAEPCKLHRVNKAILEAPAADVKPVVHAHWEVFTDSSGRDDIRCSSCKQTPHWTVTDIEAAPLYCPNCGAEVIGDQIADDF